MNMLKEVRMNKSNNVLNTPEISEIVADAIINTYYDSSFFEIKKQFVAALINDLLSLEMDEMKTIKRKILEGRNSGGNLENFLKNNKLVVSSDVYQGIWSETRNSFNF